MTEYIQFEGIETNNLKAIDIELEKRTLNLIIGPSGSGKSSLAYDTIAQIGQHEYLAMFADDVVEPSYKVKSYRNMVVAVPMKQSNGNNNMHSTIGTYFGLTRSIIFIYAALAEIGEERFTLNRVGNICENCHGLGFVSELDINKIIDYSIPISKNPFRCWNTYKDFYCQILEKFCDEVGIDSNKTFRQLSEKEKQTLLYGEGKKKYKLQYKRTNGTSQRTSYYYGIMTGKSMMPNYKPSGRFYSDRECPCCHGMKYAPEVEQYKIHNLSIGEFMTMPFKELLLQLKILSEEMTDQKLVFALRCLQCFVQKAVDLNLGHLFFHRAIPTLSGGELQRLRMVQVFTAQLSDMLIVLDEPLAGLSGIEQRAVYTNIISIAAKHTVLVVDHSDTFVSHAKRVFALGPGGGVNGGRLIDAKSYLVQESAPYRMRIEGIDKTIHAKITSPVYHYQGVDVSFALNRMNFITGASGVGKSTLLREYLPQIFEGYLYINQKPLMGNKTSSVITAMDLFGRIQDVFAKKTGKDRRLFSNQLGCEGACPICGGSGFIEFGNDNRTKVSLSCDECEGSGFNKLIKKYRVGRKSMFDIWKMTIDDAAAFFTEYDQKISAMMQEASSVLLGHLQLGQPTSSLSGGENIRLKILKAAKTTATVLGIDEPFKGLSPSEVYRVAQFFDRIRMKGKTLIIVDHSSVAEQYFSKKILLTVSHGILSDAIED